MHLNFCLMNKSKISMALLDDSENFPNVIYSYLIIKQDDVEDYLYDGMYTNHDNLFDGFIIPASYVHFLNLFQELLELSDIEEVEHKSLSRDVCIENKNVNEQCSICFNVLNKCIELPCKHCFHKDCIIPWFKNNNTCPNCRVEFIETSNNTLTIKDDDMNFS